MAHGRANWPDNIVQALDEEVPGWDNRAVLREDQVDTEAGVRRTYAYIEPDITKKGAVFAASDILVELLSVIVTPPIICVMGSHGLPGVNIVLEEILSGE